MGLDVSLFKRTNPNVTFEQFTAAKEKLGELEETLYGEAPEGMPYDEKEEWVKNRIKETHLGVFVDSGEERSPETPSAKYPEHMFNLSYMRSSYNDSGTNRWLQTNCNTDLYKLFDVGDHDCYIPVDWAATRDRLKALLETLIDPKPTYHVMHVSDLSGVTRMFENGADEKIMTIFREQLAEAQKRTDEYGKCYSNREGLFCFDTEPMKIRAVIPRGPAVYLICESNDEVAKWYINAIEIALEMVEFVMAQPDANLYFLYWSG